jgi:hypothetical protein
LTTGLLDALPRIGLERARSSAGGHSTTLRETGETARRNIQLAQRLHASPTRDACWVKVFAGGLKPGW